MKCLIKILYFHLASQLLCPAHCARQWNDFPASDEKKRTFYDGRKKFVADERVEDGEKIDFSHLKKIAPPKSRQLQQGEEWTLLGDVRESKSVRDDMEIAAMWKSSSF